MKLKDMGLWMAGAFAVYVGWIVYDMNAAPASGAAGGSSITEVRTAVEPVLVEFYADWCGPCKAVAPEVEQLKEELAGRAKVVKINIDQNRDAAREHGIRGVPTFIAFRGGREVARQAGAIPRDMMKAMLGL